MPPHCSAANFNPLRDSTAIPVLNEALSNASPKETNPLTKLDKFDTIVLKVFLNRSKAFFKFARLKKILVNIVLTLPKYILALLLKDFKVWVALFSALLSSDESAFTKTVKSLLLAMEKNKENKKKDEDDLRNLILEVGGFDINQKTALDQYIDNCINKYLKRHTQKQKHKEELLRKMAPVFDWNKKYVEPYIIPVLLAILLIASITIFILYH